MKKNKTPWTYDINVKIDIRSMHAHKALPKNAMKSDNIDHDINEYRHSDVNDDNSPPQKNIK